MKAKVLTSAVGISLLFLLPVLAVAPVAAATQPNGLDAAFWKGTFFGNTMAAWPSCTSETSWPEGSASFATTAPTTTEVDPNIAHGQSTGFYWDESSTPGFGSGTGTGFTVGGVTFINTEFSVEWTGYIWLNSETTYYFQLMSDDGSQLLINTTPGSSTITSSNLILNNAVYNGEGGVGTQDYEQGTSSAGPVTVTTSGWYPIEVDYYETCDSQSGIDLSWSTSSTGSFTIIPTTAFTPAAIGSNANYFSPPPSGVPQFGLAAPAVAAMGLVALIFVRRKSLPHTGTTA
jgi:hypothetical protein